MGGCDPGWRFTWERLANGQIESERIALLCTPKTGGPAQLTDGFTIETSPAAERWWRDAARLLYRGKLLTFDYGFMDEEKFLAGRKHGTVRAYHKHQSNLEVLDPSGEQDLTRTSISQPSRRRGKEGFAH